MINTYTDPTEPLESTFVDFGDAKVEVRFYWEAAEPGSYWEPPFPAYCELREVRIGDKWVLCAPELFSEQWIHEAEEAIYAKGEQ